MIFSADCGVYDACIRHPELMNEQPKETMMNKVGSAEIGKQYANPYANKSATEHRLTFYGTLTVQTLIEKLQELPYIDVHEVIEALSKPAVPFAENIVKHLVPRLTEVVKSHLEKEILELKQDIMNFRDLEAETIRYRTELAQAAAGL